MQRCIEPNVAAILVLGMVATAWMQTRRGSPDRVQERLEKEVRHELVMLRFYGVFDNLEFKVDGRRVTLLGQVTSPTLKTEAERVVKGIEGVESVDNQIEVLPLSPNDDRIRRAVYRAIYGNPNLDRYALRRPSGERPQALPSTCEFPPPTCEFPLSKSTSAGAVGVRSSAWTSSPAWWPRCRRA